MRTRSRTIAILAMLIAPLALVASCSSTGNGQPGNGGIFKWGTTSPIDSLNPFVAVQQNSFYAFEYVYPFLVQYGPKLQIVSDFGQSWHSTDGGRTLTFSTRARARWSDGRPLTARDAAWTINTVLKYRAGATASQAGSLNGVASASAPNATTLVIRYQHPVPGALAALQGLPILPEHIWGKLARSS